ncbi:MAG: hypothetical protein ABIK43_02345 [candidate division WOR-3 bacterium]
MSVLGFALLFVRVLPAELAVTLARCLVILYLLFRRDYRREITRNLLILCNRKDSFFWIRNGWNVGRNLALMAGIGTRRCDQLIDRAEVRCDNSTRCLLEQELQIAMFSCHFGLWEFLPLVFARAGYTIGVLTGKQGDRTLSQVVPRLRGQRNIRLLSHYDDVWRCLRGCTIIGFLVDNTRRGGQSWISVDGLHIRVPQVGFRLAKQNQMFMVPVWGFLERGRLRVCVGRSGEGTDVVAQLLDQVRRRPQEWILWGKNGALERAA